MIIRAKGAIQGIVQGVGFRPFIYQLALRHHLSGYVMNTPQGVEVEVEGEAKAVRSFFTAVASDPPPLAQISFLKWSEIAPRKDKGFEIRESQGGGGRSTLISPDVCVCEDCLAEMHDPSDRRAGYPFINCTHCGPRYTIITDIPYDRASTTMKVFQMCPACLEEYQDPQDRRFHAQPNACWDCGPSLSLHDGVGNRITCGDPVRETMALLAQDHILAIKGLGGFHLAVDAANPRAVTRLRKRKHREEKPLAIMIKDLETAHTMAFISEEEARLLLCPQRPIVLLRKRRFHGLAPQVAPRNKHLGLMLPYTPLHHLLMQGPYKALVMTSGNRTEEPITLDNASAFENLKGIADYFLCHNRDIYLRSDDSVLRVMDKVPRQIRRSRGYVPVPIFLSPAWKDMAPVLAVGGELKSTICLTKENRAFMSQHIGDMENLETFDFFKLTVDHLQRILEIKPRVLAHDLHPDYMTSRFAREQKDLPALGVQHHHGHIVSCLAEHGVQGPVIGLALDGTGYGTDAAIWGGEILLADLVSFKRVAHLDYVRLPGGDRAARFPWRIGLVYLHRAFGDDLFHFPIPFVRTLDPQEARVVIRMAEKGIHSPWTSSCGRLFDAVAALIGLRQRIAYEGQAAIELEMCQDSRAKGEYPFEIRWDGDPGLLMTQGIIQGVVEDIQRGEGKAAISRRFHNTLIQMFGKACEEIRNKTGIKDVAMSGGAFQNATLLAGLTRRLADAGLTVYTHSKVPPNDGSLALGQAVCAGMKVAGMKGRWEDHEVLR